MSAKLSRSVPRGLYAPGGLELCSTDNSRVETQETSLFKREDNAAKHRYMSSLRARECGTEVRRSGAIVKGKRQTAE